MGFYYDDDTDELATRLAALTSQDKIEAIREALEIHLRALVPSVSAPQHGRFHEDAHVAGSRPDDSLDEKASTVGAGSRASHSGIELREDDHAEG